MRPLSTIQFHLRERAAEMRVSSKELKDNNTAAVIMRLADLYDRLADRAETRGNRAVPADGEGDENATSIVSRSH